MRTARPTTGANNTTKSEDAKNAKDLQLRKRPPNRRDDRRLHARHHRTRTSGTNRIKERQQMKKKIININYDGERLAKALKELEK